MHVRHIGLPRSAVYKAGIDFCYIALNFCCNFCTPQSLFTLHTLSSLLFSAESPVYSGPEWALQAVWNARVESSEGRWSDILETQHLPVLQVPVHGHQRSAQGEENHCRQQDYDRAKEV